MFHLYSVILTGVLRLTASSPLSSTVSADLWALLCRGKGDGVTFIVRTTFLVGDIAVFVFFAALLEPVSSPALCFVNEGCMGGNVHGVMGCGAGRGVVASSEAWAVIA